jgi:hypothetical protein
VPAWLRRGRVYSGPKGEGARVFCTGF